MYEGNFNVSRVLWLKAAFLTYTDMLASFPQGKVSSSRQQESPFSRPAEDGSPSYTITRSDSSDMAVQATACT